jgi:hypothetical protein
MPRALPMILLPLLLAACSRPTQTTLTLQPGQYGAAFEAAKHVLRDQQFDIERVDARAGVITTAPHPTAGLLTPWDTQQTSLGQEIEDAVHNQQRTVRITFEPQQPPAPSPGAEAPPPDLTEFQAPLTMRVRVIQDRLYRPLWRIDTTSIRISTHAFDPDLARRQMQPEYAVAMSEDRQLAARITLRISERLAEASEK